VNLLLYGAPGSGKGTQANMLRSHFAIPHIATGDMLRAEIQAGTDLGRKAQPILAVGQYVSDDIMIGMIRNRLRQPDCERGFIIDGFPRTVPQAEALDKLMDELGRRFDRVIYLKVDVEELLLRLSGRLVCPVCQRTYPPGTLACEADGSALVQREDDKADAVKPRIEKPRSVEPSSPHGGCSGSPWATGPAELAGLTQIPKLCPPAFSSTTGRPTLGRPTRLMRSRVMVKALSSPAVPSW